MTNWIKCSERLPNDEEKVLCYSKWVSPQGYISKWIRILMKTDNERFIDGEYIEYENVTHWQNLPEAPND